MNWTCPRCKTVNETVTNEVGQVLAEQTCSKCGLIVDAEVEEPKWTPPPPVPNSEQLPKLAGNPTTKKTLRKTGSNLGTLLFVLGGLGCAIIGLLTSIGINLGLAITGGGLALIGVAMIYHIGERLELILEELQNQNDKRR